MTMTKRLIRWLAPGLLLLLALSCGAQQPAAPFQPPEATSPPDISATVTARDRALPQGGPLPTAVPPQAIQAAQDFAAAQDALSTDWDQVHRDLAGWRLGLTSCHESSVSVALIGFSGEFKGISQTARDLSRHPTVRSMSDQLIEAAQREESALRRLRDSWQAGQSGPSPELIPQPEAGPSFSGGRGARPDLGPANAKADKEPGNRGTTSAPQAGYEDAALARYEALDLRKRVADQLNDLTDRTSVSAQSQVEIFLSAIDSLSAQWDRFHDDYESFRVAQPSLAPSRTLNRLNALVEQHRQLVLKTRTLPTNPATQQVSEILAVAVQKEDSGLRRLRNSYQQLQDGANGGASSSSRSTAGSLSTVSMGQENGVNRGTVEEGPTPAPPPVDLTPEGQSNIGSGGLGIFDAFEEQLGRTGETRRQASLELDQAVSEASAANRAVVADFTAGNDGLLEQWRSFHRDYDAWLATEGGCDRAAVTATLGDFALRMGEIAYLARQLPQATSLRPLGELTVEAAQREEEALKQLRGNWRPFATSVYEGLDQELNASGKLRRQVDLGIQDLLERYGIPEA